MYSVQLYSLKMVLLEESRNTLPNIAEWLAARVAGSDSYHKLYRQLVGIDAYSTVKVALRPSKYIVVLIKREPKD
jgi:hypothetical protein